MANPRQRRKARSATHRPVSHSRNAKKNLKKTQVTGGPTILQEAWDKHKTVRQNYAKLGLAVTLNPSLHGGVEKCIGQTCAPQASDNVASSSEALELSAVGRIIRDQDGTVIGVDIHDNEAEVEELGDRDFRLNPWTRDFSYTNGVVNGDSRKTLADLIGKSVSTSGSTTLAFPLSGVGTRHLSSGEIKYLTPLCRKYGTNLEAMAGDLKLNPEQRTIGQLGRSLRKAGFLAV